MQLNDRSLKNLQGVHESLVRVVLRAAEITPVDFIVTEGLRTLARQKVLVAKGASKTLRSRHLTGHAVDLAAVIDGEVSWDWPLYYKIADAMFDAAEDENVPIEWGGHWKFKDGPHYQLPWAKYPASTAPTPHNNCQALVLSKGDKGPCVRRLQRAFNSWASGAEAPIYVDGSFGPKTHDALETLQFSKGLVVDGIVGPATWKALEPYL